MENAPVTERCEFERPRPFNLFLFGATGDLARRKIMPALYQLHALSLLPGDFMVVGSARSAMSTEDFRGQMRKAVREAASGKFDAGKWEGLEKRLHYIPTGDARSYRDMLKKCAPLETRFKTCRNRIFYLAVPPPSYADIISNLGEAGAGEEAGAADEGYTHIVVEKPFGRDLDSAGALNALLRKYFREDQIYRMDHYLAKETVQNILVFRFSNSIFEPLWNRHFIDHVQITASETIGVEHRGKYYEDSGVLRDMFQNHLLHLLALIAMEPPPAFRTEKVREERSKALGSIKPLDPERLEDFLVVGQYGPGTAEGEKETPGYRSEPDISRQSNTATYAALKLEMENWRWHGVPFYLRSGKRLASRRGEISIHFKPVPHKIFGEFTIKGKPLPPNTLSLCIQPVEKFDLLLHAKQPGSKICLGPVRMDYTYSRGFNTEDYARILLDCMQGDQMLFTRTDEVEASWELLTPVIKKVEGLEMKDFPNYRAGSTGPASADSLLSKDGRAWDPL